MVNKGANANEKDGFGQTAEYYVEHPMQIQIPGWQNKWQDYVPEYARSPTPGRKSLRERKSAIQKAAMEARKSSRRKRDGKTIFNIFFMLSYFYIYL